MLTLSRSVALCYCLPAFVAFPLSFPPSLMFENAGDTADRRKNSLAAIASVSVACTVQGSEARWDEAAIRLYKPWSKRAEFYIPTKPKFDEVIIPQVC